MPDRLLADREYKNMLNRFSSVMMKYIVEIIILNKFREGRDGSNIVKKSWNTDWYLYGR